MNPQSDQERLRLFTTTLAATKATAHTAINTPRTIVVVVREAGLSKFGSCPLGGLTIGMAQRSVPGGISEEAMAMHVQEQAKSNSTKR